MGTLRLYQVDYDAFDNYYIEDIETYFDSLPSTAKRESWDKLNYLKLGMNITIKLPLDQVHQIENTCNYAVIEQDGNKYYYFVISAGWVAKKTVQLVMTLDTVQTFFTRLQWSDKTQIIRETRDRITKLNGNTYLRKIDRYNEGMNPIKAQNANKATINSEIGGKWYLTYMSNPGTTQDSTGNPMFMGLLSDVPYLIYPAVSNDDITYSWNYFKNKIVYITSSSTGDNPSITISGVGTIYLGTTASSTTTFRAYALQVDDTTAPSIQARKLWYTGDTYPYSFSEGDWGSIAVPSTATITFHNIRVIAIVDKTDYYSQLTSLDKLDSLATTVINAGTLPAVYTTSYSNFDNSNNRLSKIIELPYPPLDITKQSDGTYLFDNCTFHYGYKIMQFNGSRLSSFVANDTRLQDLLYVTLTDPTGTDAPNMSLESKLYSSEFYDYAYYYDTEKLPIRLEDISTQSLNCSINITYNTTTSMNSDKQFYFSTKNATYNENQLYELYLNCPRSTEKMILNDSYADYIKNGYNYDQWNQKRNEKIATLNTIVGLGQGLFSIATPLIGGIKNWQIAATERSLNISRAESYERQSDIFKGMAGAYGKLSKGYMKENDRESLMKAQELQTGALRSGIEYADRANDQYIAAARQKRGVVSELTGMGSLVLSTGITAAQTAINTAMSIESSQMAFQNALSSKANVPVSASGNVPTDLFDNYSSNKLKRAEFTLREEDRLNLSNTFRLTGYSHPVQEKPVFNSRIYSNFVQCTPNFLNSYTEIYKVYLDDIKQRFQAGVTVKHCYNGRYDLHDEYENYETFVMEE